MAFAPRHGKDIKFLFNGRKFSDAFQNISMPGVAEPVETTGFSLAAKTYIQGLIDGTASAEGFFSNADTLDVDARLNASIAKTDDSLWAYIIGVDAAGNKARCIRAISTSVTKDATFDGALMVTLEGQSVVGIENSTILFPETTLTTTTNSTTHDNLVATTAGGSAYVHLLTATAPVGFALTLRNSTDNFAADDTLLATFTIGASSGNHERIIFSGTVKRYVRAALTLASGTVVLWVAYYRNA